MWAVNNVLPFLKKKNLENISQMSSTHFKELISTNNNDVFVHY